MKLAICSVVFLLIPVIVIYCLYSRRNSSGVNRDDLIRDLAEMVLRRHPENRADLKHPQLAVIVEVIRNMCCLSVLPDYYELRKYNLLELCAPEGGIEVVDGKRDKLGGGRGEGDAKLVGGKSDEIEEEVPVAKEDRQKQAVKMDPNDSTGDSSKTAASEFKDTAKEIKESDDAGYSKKAAEGVNIEK